MKKDAQNLLDTFFYVNIFRTSFFLIYSSIADFAEYEVRSV